MSAKHPIIAITGSSGAGTTTVQRTFEQIFRREGLERRRRRGRQLPPLRPRRDEGPHGRGRAPPAVTSATSARRRTCSTRSRTLFRDVRRDRHGQAPLLPAQRRGGRGVRPGARHVHAVGGRLADDTDLLFYEGLHGAVVHDDVDVRAVPGPAHRRRAGRQPRVDPEDQPRLPLPRLLGRGRHRRHPSPDARLRALHLPAVLAHARELPARADRGHVQPVHRARHPVAGRDRCSSSASRTRRASTSRTCCRCCTTRSCRGRTRIVCPGGKMDLAMQLIFTPFIWRMAERRKKALAR